MTARANGVMLLVALAAPLRAQEDARAAVRRADLALSQQVFDSGAISVMPRAMTSGAVLVWPGAAVVTGAQGKAFFDHQPLLATAKISWQPFRVELSKDSTLAVMAGVATFDRPGDGGMAPIHRIGRFLEAWYRRNGRWELQAFAIANLITPAETIWTSELGPAELPYIRSIGRAAAFIAADSSFAAEAGRSNAATAFGRWAAPDATTFSGTGEINIGPQAIGASLAGNTAHWTWGAVAAGASDDGSLGWTVGQATITPAGGGAPAKSKYLTLWRRMPDGAVRFVADGGNGRP